MEMTLRATLTSSYLGDPLAVVENLPGQGAELTPAQLRRLAAALNTMADDCEAIAKRPKPRKGSLPAVSKTYTAEHAQAAGKFGVSGRSVAG